MICSPSFLSCDFTRLESEIMSISNAKWLHFDVMDGKFVPNYTYNHTMLKDIKRYSKQFFDCHLMIREPEKHYLKYIEAGADLVTFHLEATENPLDLINHIKRKKIKVGVSIKPKTDIAILEPYLSLVDLILIMSVEPGKGGQKFLPDAIDKIAYLNQKRIENKFNYLIEVDGGINFLTAESVKEAGCDVIVVGSFIFNKDNREEIIAELENV